MEGFLDGVRAFWRCDSGLCPLVGELRVGDRMCELLSDSNCCVKSRRRLVVSLSVSGGCG